MKNQFISLLFIFCSIAVFSQKHLKERASNYNPYKHIQFIENQGQWQNDVLFKAHANKNVLRFLNNGVSYAAVKNNKAEHFEYVVWNQRFLGSNTNTVLKGSGHSKSKTNYLKGKDADQWVINADQYENISYENLYDDIDLAYYSVKGEIKYDYILHPSANVQEIQVKFEGIKGLSIDKKGRLVIETPLGSYTEKAPYSYQVIDGKQKEVEVVYRLLDENTFGFEVLEEYDKHQPLIIDPFMLEWAGFLDVDGYTLSTDIEITDNGDAIVSGYAHENLLTTPGSYQPNIGNQQGNSLTDGFISRISADGSTLIYSTYIGGDHRDQINNIVLLDDKKVIFEGRSLSSNFPITANALQPNAHGYSTGDEIVGVLNADGTAIIACTYFNHAWIEQIKLDASGNVLIAGQTHPLSTSSLPVTSNAYQTNITGNTDAFVAILTQDLSNIIYCTYYGGSYKDVILDVSIMPNQDIVVCGQAQSVDLPSTSNAFMSSVPNNPSGSLEYYYGFIAKFDQTLSSLNYATYLTGTESFNTLTSIKVIGDNEVAVLGHTRSHDFPVTQNVYQGSFEINNDRSFTLSTFSFSSGLIASTFFGEFPITSFASESNLEVLESGSFLISGTANEQGTIETTPGALMPTNPAPNGPFNSSFIIASLSSDLSNLIYGSYWGGSFSEGGNTSTTIKVHNNALYLAAHSSSPDIPTTPFSFNPNNNTVYQSSYVSKFSCVENNLSVTHHVVHDTSVSAVGSIQTTVFNGAEPYQYHWSNGDTSNFNSALSAGIYVLTLTDAQGCNLVDTVLINDDPTSNTLQELPNISLYPNPNQGNLRIMLNTSLPYPTQISITNTLGQIVYSSATSPFKKNIELDLSNLSNGSYQLQITNDFGVLKNKAFILHK